VDGAVHFVGLTAEIQTSWTLQLTTADKNPTTAVIYVGRLTNRKNKKKAADCDWFSYGVGNSRLPKIVSLDKVKKK
jgi:hypothetical protein